MAAIVRLENVDVIVDGVPILHRISFEIGTGQHWGVTGANGSGKSTLLALLAGLRWPAPGSGVRSYDFGDGPERDAVRARRKVTLLGHELQDLYFKRHWNFKALDIVRSGLTRSDIPLRNPSREQIESANSLLATVGLESLAERRFLTLSRGEQRRVLIARALGFAPTLLLLDEPASGLDAESRRKLEQTLDNARAYTQLVIATHLPSELPAFITNRAHIDKGRLRIVDSGKIRTVDERIDRKASAASTGPKAQDLRRGEPDSEPETLIRIDHASIWLDGKRILDDLTWKIRRGEQWLITGPNGAGKSTLLRLLHAELRPARGGTVAWPAFGNPRNVWELRRIIALVSPELQARYLFPSTVFEAIASGFRSSIGLTHELTEAESERVDRLLEGFELTEFSARRLSGLSYGQRHRVLIARTLASDPAILLLDEPWEGLDAATSGIVSREISRFIAQGGQVVCVSHVGPRGLPCNLVLRLDKGRSHSMPVTALNRAKIHPVGTPQQEATQHTDANLECFAPRVMAIDSRGPEGQDPGRAQQDETQAPMQAEAEAKSDHAGRHHEPEHKPMKMLAFSEGHGSDRKHRNEHRYSQAVDQANGRQGDRDLIEVAGSWHRPGRYGPGWLRFRGRRAYPSSCMRPSRLVL